MPNHAALFIRTRNEMEEYKERLQIQVIYIQQSEAVKKPIEE
jgi:hypothetical protein